ncbi:hypothetical protein AC1031_000172 [Aphanomyces cochlioides]|nr:hypothetical protein AC1031_000172 [Aphanomyces cochlioides]
MEEVDGKAKGGRLSKRRNERIRTFYKINHNMTTRCELSPEEIQEYVQHIDNKCLAKFGVIKLSKYNLNVCCAVVDNVKLSLLRYAAIRSSNVCLALFYAGADPAYDCYEDEILYNDARPLLLRYPTPYIVWLNSLLATAKPQNGQVCKQCDASSSPVIVLSPCNHAICQTCFWQHLSTLRIDQDFSCPVCLTEVINLASKCPPRPPPSTKTPQQIAEISYRAYSQLSHIPPKGHKSVKPSLDALPLWSALQLFVGLTPKQRDAEMFKAVAADNAARIRALVHVGVDVNCRNEYGQTPLFVACWMGYSHVVDALLTSGAAPDIADNANILPIQTTLANGHVDIAARLGGSLDILASPAWQSPTTSSFVELIPSKSSHPGAGSGYYDNMFSDEFLLQLESLHKTLPVAPKEKISCSDRSYFCDSMGWVIDAIRQACGKDVFPNMRFLHYNEVGGSLPPHVDLSRTDIHGVTSTKTFILYLSSCTEGGETNFLTSPAQDNVILAGVKPQRGRLLIFPHNCPHEGAVVQHVPKLLLRGEMY